MPEPGLIWHFNDGRPSIPVNRFQLMARLGQTYIFGMFYSLFLILMLLCKYFSDRSIIKSYRLSVTMEKNQKHFNPYANDENVDEENFGDGVEENNTENTFLSQSCHGR